MVAPKRGRGGILAVRCAGRVVSGYLAGRRARAAISCAVAARRRTGRPRGLDGRDTAHFGAGRQSGSATQYNGVAPPSPPWCGGRAEGRPRRRDTLEPSRKSAEMNNTPYCAKINRTPLAAGAVGLPRNTAPQFACPVDGPCRQLHWWARSRSNCPISTGLLNK